MDALDYRASGLFRHVLGVGRLSDEPRAFPRKGQMARSKKAATVETRERDKDKRLRKTYGITLADYNRILAAQDGRCAICGREPKTKPLNVDHIHFHVTAHRIGLSGILPGNHDPKWMAEVSEFPNIRVFGATRVAVEREARRLAFPRSVRGLLCAGRYAGCNRKLGRIDNREWLEKVLAYLLRPPAKEVLDLSTST